jgi:hypothetical protein
MFTGPTCAEGHSPVAAGPTRVALLFITPLVASHVAYNTPPYHPLVASPLVASHPSPGEGVRAWGTRGGCPREARGCAWRLATSGWRVLQAMACSTQLAR